MRRVRSGADLLPMSADLDQIYLASAPPLKLGDLEARPSTCEVLSPTGREILQPRVMQVLVALADARGQVVSRDVLIRRCWEGRAVGDDAINRCIAKLRQLGGASSAFTVETVPRVGFRLSEPAPAAIDAHSRRASVCVLPFANLTGDPAKDYFSDGMAEELICTLARTPGLKVPARTSSFAYKGRNVDVRKIADDLSVGAVLEGSVRSAGERIRVTAQLIDAISGFHLWSQNYDRRFEDLFALQDELAAAIAGALRVHLTPSAPPTRDLEAYQLYMRAVSMAGRSDERALELLDEAIARDPSFARAHAAKAGIQFFLLSLDFRRAGLAAEIERSAARALALDPTLADVKGIAGAVHALHARWTEAAECFEAAVALDEANPSLCGGHGFLVERAVGHCAAAVTHMRKAFALAPAVPAICVNLAVCLHYAGRGVESADYIRIAEELGFSADHPLMIIMRSKTAVDAGRFDEARDEILKLFPPDIRAAGADEAVARVCSALIEPSQSDAAVAALAELHLERLATWPISSGLCLHMYAALGALDHAYAIAERILQEFESTGIINVVVVGHVSSLWFPHMRAFRQDPRFQDLVRRLNFFPYWRRYGPPDGHTLDGDRLIVG